MPVAILWAIAGATTAYFVGQVQGRTAAGDTSKPLEIAGWIAIGAAAGYLFSKAVSK